MHQNRVRINGVELGWTIEDAPRPYVAAQTQAAAYGAAGLLFPDTVLFENVKEIPGRPAIQAAPVKLLADSWGLENNRAIKWSLDELATFVLAAPGACQLALNIDFPQLDFRMPLVKE